MSVAISIIVPVYKVPLEYLRECFDSLLAQTMQECEFVVVSDGAPEGECSICEEYEKKDSRFRFFKREHAGVSAARNYGISKSNGDYIIFVDADDWIARETLNSVSEFIKNTKTDIIFWNYSFVFPTGEKRFRYASGSIPFLDQNKKNELYKELFFCTNSRFVSLASPVNKAYKSSIFTELKFDEQLSLGEDRIFNICTLRNNFTISYLDKNLYFCREVESSASHRYRPNAFKTLLQYINQMKIIGGDQFKNEIGKEIVIKFIESFYTDYFHKKNTLSFSKKLDSIMDIIRSKSFQQDIKYSDYAHLSPTRKLDLFFLKKKSRLWITFRAIAASIQTTIIYPLYGRH